VAFDNWGGTIRQEELPGIMRLRKLRPKVKVPASIFLASAVRTMARCGFAAAG